MVKNGWWLTNIFYHIIFDTCHFVAAVLFFGNSIYSINESTGLVETTIRLSNPLSTGLAVTVKSNDGNATGKSAHYYHI